jgi:hypothetical protein
MASQEWLFGIKLHEVVNDHRSSQIACLSGSNTTKQHRHKELAEYFAGHWARKRKPYNTALRDKVQNIHAQMGLDACETSADRQVPAQPLVLSGNLFAVSDPKSRCKLNARRIKELADHLIRSTDTEGAARELMSTEYIAAKFVLGEGLELIREYNLAIGDFKHNFPDVVILLSKSKASILSNFKYLSQHPAIFTLQFCSQLPDEHPLFLSAKRIMDTNPAYRVLNWVNKVQNIDPCQLVIEEYTNAVNAVVFFPQNETRLAACGEDGIIMILNTVTGRVVSKMYGHEEGVNQIDVSKDCNYLVSAGNDKTVRMWNLASEECKWTSKTHRFCAYTFCILTVRSLL